MKPIVHCHLPNVSLWAILHALADPKRLEMLALISNAEHPIETKFLIGERSTSSTHDHLAVLRQAGLIRTSKSGSSLAHCSRLPEHDESFQAVVLAILAANPCGTQRNTPRRKAEELWMELAR